MKFSNHLTRNRITGPLSIALLAGTCGIMPVNIHAVEKPEAEANRGGAAKSFATSDEAIAALQTAAAAKDQDALSDIFGPESRELLTGDKVQDANNAERFAKALEQSCHAVKEGDAKITIEVGTNNWPMPIPLVMANGQWHFDTAAGKEEIISRHIGKDELHAISVCRAYVTAQLQYAHMVPKVGGGAAYAQKFKSAPGMKDGLYWVNETNEPASPFGALVAQAHAEGYGTNGGTGLHAFHGYYFRILTAQGFAAPGGKMDYMSDGILGGGFALVAYPEKWDKSGIMTFIVSKDGKVYQKDLSDKTAEIAGAMKEYNPGTDWVEVTDVGALNVVSEK